MNHSRSHHLQPLSLVVDLQFVTWISEGEVVSVESGLHIGVLQQKLGEVVMSLFDIVYNQLDDSPIFLIILLSEVLVSLILDNLLTVYLQIRKSSLKQFSQSIGLIKSKGLHLVEGRVMGTVNLIFPIDISKNAESLLPQF